jgi:hypothetical protein
MEFKTIEWDREKLYDQIWTSPLRTVPSASVFIFAGILKEVHVLFRIDCSGDGLQ